MLARLNAARNIGAGLRYGGQQVLASQRARLERLRGFAARGEIAVARELNAHRLPLTWQHRGC